MAAKGKSIWGSTRYYINIEPNTNHFSTAMGGMVSFYDQAGLINEKRCDNLHDLARAVLEFWSTILAPHETRVARWIEEFFSEIGIASDYKLILRLLKTDKLLEESIDDLIVSTKEFDTTQLEQDLGIDEDTKIIAKELKVTKIPNDEYAKNEFIQKLIRENKYHVPEKIKSKNQFTAPDGTTVEQEKENLIEIGKGIGDYKIISGLTNSFDEPIKNVSITDQLPYCFKLDKMEIEGANVQPLKNKTQDYLEIIWNIPEIEPQNKVEIKYALKQKINRTVIEISDNELLTTMNSFESIKSEGLDFIASPKYLNIHNKVIDEIYITDYIPPEFNIIRSNPDIIPPSGILEKAKMKGIIVRWKHKAVKVGQFINKTYRLDYFPFLFRIKKIVEDDNGETILKIAKYIYSKERESGYKMLFIIKAIKPISDVISIEDKIHSSNVIVKKEPNDLQLIEETKENIEKKILTFIVEPPKVNDEIRFSINISGNEEPDFEAFKVYIGDKEEQLIEQETGSTREMIKLPE